MRTLVFAAVQVLASGSVTAQQASYEYPWQPCPCPIRLPVLRASGVPRIGGSFVAHAPTSGLVNCGEWQQAWILTGVSNSNFGGVTPHPSIRERSCAIPAACC
jgi:hypothetical protein